MKDVTERALEGALTDADYDAIAERVVEGLLPFLSLASSRHSMSEWVDAATLAKELSVSRDWVYAHADELGGQRLGKGPKARLRFDVEKARHALQEATEPASTTVEKPSPCRRRRSSRSSVPLLPIR